MSTSPMLHDDRARRRLRAIAIAAPSVFVGVTAFTVILSLLLFDSDLAEIFPTSASFAFLMAGITTSLMAFPVVSALNDRLRDVTGGDRELSRKLRRVVLRGKNDDVNGTEREVAARWAPVAASLQGWSSLQGALILVCLAPMQLINTFDRDELRPLSVASVAILLVGIVVVGPFSVVRYRRAVAYVREHSTPEKSSSD